MTRRADSKRHKQIRDEFFLELEKAGIIVDEKFPGANIFILAGRVKGLILVKIRSEGEGFWGLGDDFLNCLLYHDFSGVSQTEKGKVVKLLKNENIDVTSESLKRLHPVMRRIKLSISKGEKWACIFIRGHGAKSLWDGWVMTEQDVLSESPKWSYSRQQKQFKINESSLSQSLRQPGLSKIIARTIQVLE